ncbi:RagB/SusD family nutrient uptake outer membrane protein [Sphingobacterium lactis]|uniref:RagB/SusD family nutrient uptake outer membrane protein n=1 Tax=Sphingobacterium lactis TaxID=797291 RepID=UPI000CDE84C5|nr:RagB/SusD family nutrient uptake outer membrane protein [Sphingobacterium lactis]
MKRMFSFSSIRTLVCVVAVTFASSCNQDDFFELPDRGGIDAAIWDSEGSVQLHLNRVYDVVIPQFLYQLIPDRGGVHLASDESFYPHTDQWARGALGIDYSVVLGNNDVRYVGNKYDWSAGSNRYYEISRCNAAIQNIPEGALSDQSKNHFLGQYHFLRAMVYFELAKVYGGVPLILEPIDPQNNTVSGRNSAKEVFDAVLADLDKSIAYLKDATWKDDDGRGKINQMIATSFKAKVLMYWASPQFNPVNDAKHPYDASRWQTALEANKAAYEMGLANGYKLLPNYADIFRTEGTMNTEAILVRTYTNSIERRGHDGESRSRPQSEGGSAYQGYVATTRLLDAYPMKDGNPIGKGAYTYDEVLFWKNRDPRFEATIAYNGSSWPLSGNDDRRQWTYSGAVNEGSVRGVMCKRFTMPNISSGNVRYQDNIGGNGMDWIEMRFAEVMLNYAECANETGNLALAKDLVRQIRERAGIEQGSGGNDYGLGNVAGKEGMRDLILNERMIEFAFEGKRNSDLRRTRRMHLLTGSMSTIQIALVDGNNTKAVLEATDPATGLRFRESLDINDKEVYLKYFKPWAQDYGSTNYGPYAVPAFHYFYTFHNDFVNKGANIEPTIGWSGGTFDPLDN